MENLRYNLDMTDDSEWNFVNADRYFKDNFLYLQEAGCFNSGRNYYTVRSDLDSFLIKLTISGHGLLEYDGMKYDLLPGEVFWIDCQKPHHYCTDPSIGNWNVLWVHFNGANAGSYYETFLSNTGGKPVRTLTDFERIESIMRSILKLSREYTSNETSGIEASNLLTALLTGLIINSDSDNRPIIPDSIKRIRDYLQEHYTDRITLDNLARMFSMSKYHLQRQVKQFLGYSPTEYLIKLRLTRAKELLNSTDMSVSDVGYSVGIENTSYFINLFRRAEGETPQHYRNRLTGRDHLPAQKEQIN